MLSPGTRLGPYEVTALLGAGGMGEVFRAHDIRLRREVAVKVLPEGFAASADRLRRFEREARATAALNHPNVLTVFDVGQAGGCAFVVYELLEGQTLRERLGRRRLTEAQAIGYAAQVARGLGAAHAKGIIHCDIKPENLFLTSQGVVKILDFGVARVEVRKRTLGPTAETLEEGLRIGTTSYMSPEQASGRAAGARSDIFALGIVLYEMLAEQHPFRRDTPVATLGAILFEEPPELLTHDGRARTGVARLVSRCLEKRAEDRFSSAHDLALALDLVSGEGLPTVGGGAGIGPDDMRPYPGLASFTEADAVRFFGREAEVAALWEKVRYRPLLAVIGPSGAGKTSFLRAGVIPHRPRGWSALYATPGRSPTVALVQALAPHVAGDLDAVRDLPNCEDPAVAMRLLERWRARHEGLLVVIDRMEELFALNSPSVQAAFAALLGRLVEAADVRILLGIRDDFLFRCSQEPAFGPVFRDLTPLSTPSREALRRTVREPAAREGYRFEDDDLVEEILASVISERAALPLLGFALQRLWEERDRTRRVVTREAYVRIGGVVGALAQHAEATLQQIGHEGTEFVREIFRSLTTSQGTRVAREVEELVSVFKEHRGDARRVLEQLVASRLLVSFDNDAVAVATREPGIGRHVEIVHESLLQAWPRLVRWRAQEAEGALLRDQLRQAAKLWDEKGRPQELLWTGASYLEFRVWRARFAGGHSAIEEAFGEAMVTLAGRRRRWRWMVAGAGIALSLSVAAVTFGLWRRAEKGRAIAQEQSQRREAAQLASLARLRLDDHPNAALAYAIASLERADTVEARRLAVEILWRGPPALVLSGTPGAARFSPDGRWLATSMTEGLSLWTRDTGDRRLLLAPEIEPSKGAWPAGFTANGEILVTSGVKADHAWTTHDGRLFRTIPKRTPFVDLAVVDRRLLSFIWDGARTAEERRAARITSLSLDGGPETTLGRWEATAPAFHDVDSTGTWLAWAEDDRILLRPLAALSSPPRLLGRQPAGVTAVRFGSWTDKLVTADRNGEVRMWTLPSGRRERTLHSPVAAGSVGLDPHGRFLSTGPAGPSSPRSLFLFDLEAPPDAEPQPLLNRDLEWTASMEVDPSGRWLLTTHQEVGMLWNLATPRSLVLRGQKPSHMVVGFVPDGRSLISTSDENVVRQWPLSPEGHVHTLWVQNTGLLGQAGAGLVADPGGRFVVVTSRVGDQIVMIPLTGGSRRVYRVGGTNVLNHSLERNSRHLAFYSGEYGSREAPRPGILDLASGSVRWLEKPPIEAGCAGPYWPMPLFLPNGRLVSYGVTGLRLWDPGDGSSRQLRPCGDKEADPLLAATPDSRTLVILDSPPSDLVKSTLRVYEFASQATREIVSHGRHVTTMALDPSGTTLVTGDHEGIVRVGPLGGGEPHLLYGHTGTVWGVAVSPNGKWIASGGDDGTIRLWPMPTGAPLHTRPYTELLAILKALTNLRVVQDEGAGTGFRVEVGPFPGWRTTPNW